MKGFVSAAFTTILAIGFSIMLSVALYSARFAPLTDFYIITPGVSFRLTSILVESSFYFLLVALYRERAAWVFGLFWGIDEIEFNGLVSVMHPAGILTQPPAWWLYMSTSLLFFSLSVFSLRKSFSKKWVLMGLVPLSAWLLWPIVSGSSILLYTPNVPLTGVLKRETVPQLLLGSAVILFAHRSKP